MKLSCITTLDEEGVRIVALGQKHATRSDTLRAQALCQLLRGLLATAVSVDIEGEIDSARTATQLLELFSVEMSAQ